MGKGRCGRSACTLNPDGLKKTFNVDQFRDQDKYQPSYNVSPTHYQPVLILQNGQRILMSMKWGLVPSFWEQSNLKDFNTINARVENLITSSIWRGPSKTKRCVIIANGFFEWKKLPNGQKQAYFVHFADKDKLLTMAGLYDIWKDDLHSYAVVTMEASSDLVWLHDRMPLILDTEEKIDFWLNCDISIEKVLEEMRIYKREEKGHCPKLCWYQVANIVNSVKNNSPDCIRPLEEIKKKGIESYFLPAAKKENIKIEKIALQILEPPANDMSCNQLENQNLPSLEEHDDDDIHRTKRSKT